MVEPSKPGIRRCIGCRWFFVSPDENRVRRCADCKKEDEYQPRSARIAQIEGSSGYTFRDSCS